MFNCNNEIKIGWYTIHQYLDMYASIATHLLGRGVNYKYSYVVHDRRESIKISQECQLQGQSYNLNNFLRERWESFNTDDDYLAVLESKYGQPSLSPYVLSEYYINGTGFDDIKKLLVGHIEFFEMYLTNERPDYFVSERGSLLTTNVAWAVCQYLGIKFTCLIKLPIENTYHISTNRLGFPDNLEAEYESLRERELTDSEFSKANIFLEAFVNNPSKTEDILLKSKKPKVRWTIDRLIKWVPSLVQYYKDRPYYIFRNPIYYQYEVFQRIVRFRLYGILNVFEMANVGEKYVLFPLHRMSEWSMHSSAPFSYSGQLKIIECLAMSLPIDHVLYVKEHTGHIGGREMRFYKQIKKLPRVKLITPYEDSFELIKKSSAVVVLSGSMGWEAILFEKPVIAIADAWYNSYKKVSKCGDCKDLSSVMSNAIHDLSCDRLELLKYILAVLNVSKSGYVLLNNPERLFAEDNINDVASSLHEFFVGHIGGSEC